MNVRWYDVIGLIGVGLIIVAYLLLQMERLHSRDLGYSVINLVGALLIAFSLLFAFNLSAFVIEIIWVVISILGIRKALERRTAP